MTYCDHFEELPEPVETPAGDPVDWLEVYRDLMQIKEKGWVSPPHIYSSAAAAERAAFKVLEGHPVSMSVAVRNNRVFIRYR